MPEDSHGWRIPRAASFNYGLDFGYDLCICVRHERKNSMCRNRAGITSVEINERRAYLQIPNPLAPGRVISDNTKRAAAL